MLDGLRGFAKTVPGKIFGAILLVGVAGFGISNVLLDLGSNTVATVGSQEISTRDFQRAYAGDLNRFRSQFGVVPTPEEQISLGLPRQTIERLSIDAALDDLGSRFNLGVTDDQLGRMLRADPSFADTLGTFDPASFSEVLRFSGLTEAQYFSMQRRIGGRDQITTALFGEIDLNDTAANLLGRFVGDTRTVSYFTVSPFSIETPPVPTEEELAAYLSENQGEFTTVETRTISVLPLTIETLASTIAVEEAAVEAEFEANAQRFSSPERRTIEQVSLADPANLTRFEAGLAAGEDFAALLTETGLTANPLGTRARGEITDQALADAAFGLEEGGFAIIAGIGGQRAVHVSSIEPAGEASLEEARETITASLAQAQARAEYTRVLDEVEALRAAFQPMDEIAARYDLPVYEVELTATGIELGEIPTIPPEAAQRLTQAAFAAQLERLTPTASLGANTNVFFELDAIAPVRDQTLDEVREEVVAAIERERTGAAIATLAEELVARLEAGEPVDAVAGTIGQIAQPSLPVTRSGEPGGVIDGQVAGVVFAGGPDHVGTAVNESGETIVFAVDEVTPAAEGLDAETRQALANDTLNGLYADFVSALRNEAGVRVNEQSLQQAVTTTSGI